jgi:cytochrome c-type biogenesis protein CcmF
MHVAHLGIAIFIVGVTLVGGYQDEKDLRMEIGDSVEVGGFTFRFDGSEIQQGPNYEAQVGNVAVFKDGEPLIRLRPEKRHYPTQNNMMTEAAIYSGVLRDLYVSLGEPLPNGAWSVRVYTKPFVTWIWGGCVTMALGGGLAISDRRYRIAKRKPKATASTSSEASDLSGRAPSLSEKA